MDERIIEDRIKQRARRIWEEEGRPEGRDLAHWELAKLAVAQEDGLPGALRPVNGPTAEPIEAVANQGEFPTLTDQGEQQNPGPSG